MQRQEEPPLTVPNAVLIGEVKRQLKEGRDVLLKASGGSMLPFIVGGRDSVILRRPDLCSFNRGRIVLAGQPGGRYVLHRIIGKQPCNITLMGDGNICGTETCTAADIIGTVVRIVRRGREVDCGSLAERCRVRLWLWLRPVRRPLLWLWRKLHPRASACARSSVNGSS